MKGEHYASIYSRTYPRTESIRSRYEYRSEVSPLDILWNYYISINPPDDGTIKQAVDALHPVHQALPIPLSDTLSDLVGDLTYAYVRTAFLEGIRMGMRLKEEA